jgi:quercetin dioxygenase-like cupin family protein
MAEDAVKVAPHIYKVLFENERVRLLEVVLQPGDSSEMHTHPDNLIYLLSDGNVTFTDPSGETADLEMSAGTSMWMEATEHATENVGGTRVHALFFEPK